MCYSSERLYVEQKKLWKHKEKIEIELKNIVRLREDIEMEKSMIQSDLVHEVGFSKGEFDKRYEKLFRDEARLDDTEHALGYALHEIESKLSDIFLALSQELSIKVA
jgi:ACT domain-containing protein